MSALHYCPPSLPSPDAITTYTLTLVIKLPPSLLHPSGLPPARSQGSHWHPRGQSASPTPSHGGDNLHDTIIKESQDEKFQARNLPCKHHALLLPDESACHWLNLVKKHTLTRSLSLGPTQQDKAVVLPHRDRAPGPEDTS